MHQNSKNSANKFVSIKNGMEFSITLMENYCLPSFFFIFVYFILCALLIPVLCIVYSRRTWWASELSDDDDGKCGKCDRRFVPLLNGKQSVLFRRNSARSDVLTRTSWICTRISHNKSDRLLGGEQVEHWAHIEIVILARVSYPLPHSWRWNAICCTAPNCVRQNAAVCCVSIVSILRSSSVHHEKSTRSSIYACSLSANELRQHAFSVIPHCAGSFDCSIRVCIVRSHPFYPSCAWDRMLFQFISLFVTFFGTFQISNIHASVYCFILFFYVFYWSLGRWSCFSHFPRT